MGSRGPRRLGEVALAAFIAITLVAFAAIKLLDRPTAVEYARLVDERTLVIGTVSGPGTWTRVTTVKETAGDVTLGVSSLTAPVPGTGGDILELTVHLTDPLGVRTLTDASSGLPIPKTRCVLPDFLAPYCTP